MSFFNNVLISLLFLLLAFNTSSASDLLKELEDELLAEQNPQQLPYDKTIDIEKYKNEVLEVKPTPTVIHVIPKKRNNILQNSSILASEVSRLQKENDLLRRKNIELQETINNLTYNNREHTEVQAISNVDAPQDPLSVLVTITKSPAVLRSAPSKESGRIYQIPVGKSVPVILHQGKWLKVAVNKIKGWIPTDVVSAQ